MGCRPVRPLATIALTLLPAIASAAVPVDRHPFHAIFATDGNETYQVGGFAARGDHFFVSLNGAIVVAFFARPSGGRTLAAGGPAPTSTAELGVIGRQLTEIITSAPAAARANAAGE